jgi:2-iminoacetate synthase
LTLQEYLEDYADEEGKKIGEELIKNEIIKTPDGKRKELFLKNLVLVKNGKRDLYF